MDSTLYLRSLADFGVKEVNTRLSEPKTALGLKDFLSRNFLGKFWNDAFSMLFYAGRSQVPSGIFIKFKQNGLKSSKESRLKRSSCTLESRLISG